MRPKFLPSDEDRVRWIGARLDELVAEEQALRDELFLLSLKASERPKPARKATSKRA